MQKYSYGVSFSGKYARELKLDEKQAYLAILKELPIDRVRLMSYWDEVEKSPGAYDFQELDWQIAQAKKHKINVTLCLGMRQPRWPECHIPGWAKQQEKADRQKSLYAFMEKVVSRYKNESSIESWQLENEAFNRGIGLCKDYDRKRLRREYSIVKKLDPVRPIIMSTSNTWAWQIRSPRPDIVGFSVYLSQHRNNKYHYSNLPAVWYAIKAWLIQTIWRKQVIIHELQAEPWGPGATADLSIEEQAKSMNVELLRRNLAYAQRTGINHIDLWGTEWWYWQKTRINDGSYWNEIRNLVL